jgi:hypothetical protein
VVVIVVHLHLQLPMQSVLSPLTLEVRIPLRRSELDTTLCCKICQCPAAGRLFSPGTLVSSKNETDRHDITEILLKMAFTTITLTLTLKCSILSGEYFTSSVSSPLCLSQINFA